MISHFNFFSECGYRGMNIKIDGLSAATEFAGCTVLNGNIKIELRAGPSEFSLCR